MFSTPQAIFAVADLIDQRTPIYVDVSLGGGIKGTDVAQEIHKLGFREINLATGYRSPFLHSHIGWERLSGLSDSTKAPG